MAILLLCAIVNGPTGLFIINVICFGSHLINIWHNVATFSSGESRLFTAGRSVCRSVLRRLRVRAPNARANDVGEPSQEPTRIWRGGWGSWDIKNHCSLHTRPTSQRMGAADPVGEAEFVRSKFP
jgi:hypothetical protein